MNYQPLRTIAGPENLGKYQNIFISMTYFSLQLEFIYITPNYKEGLCIHTQKEIPQHL